jgi:hypothetical protein
MKLHTLSRYAWLAWAGPLVVCTGLAADLPPPSAPEVLELPKLTVTNVRQLPKPESWRYTKIPGVEVLSNASNSSTQRFVKDFQMLQQVIDATWPGTRSAAAVLPTTVILYGRGEGARAFLKPKGTLVGDDEVIEFQPVDAEDEEAAERRGRIASRFLGDEEAACIVVDLYQGAGGLTDPYRQFYGEYVRYLMTRLDAPAPPWLVEGVVRLYSGLDFTKDWIHFAQVGDGSGGHRIGDFNMILGRAPLAAGSRPTDFAATRPLPSPGVYGGGAFPSLAEMLQAPRILEVRQRALAHAFVHMCLYGRGQRYQKAFFTYLERLKGGTGTPALFEECFGMSIRKMQDELVGYVSFTDYKMITLRAKKGGGLVIPPPAVLRDATQAEVGRIKGQGLILARQPDAARLEFIAPYVRGMQDADLVAALGLYELSDGRTDRGRKFLESAVAGRTTRAKAYVELARLRYAAAGARTLDEKQREAVLAPLRLAGGLPPPLVDGCELMVKLWSESSEKPPAGDLVLMEAGARRFSRNLGLVYQTAQLLSEGGRVAQAAELADWGQKAAREAKDRERFAQLRATLPAVVPPGGK